MRAACVSPVGSARAHASRCGTAVKSAANPTNDETPMRFAVFDRLLHPSLLEGTPEQVRLARTTATFIGLSWFAGPLFIPVMIAIGDYTSAWSCALSALFVGIPVLVMRRYAKRVLAVHIMLFQTACALAPSVAMQGGIYGPALDWLMLLPLLAVLLLPRRDALVWLGVTVAIISGYGGFAFAGVQFPTVSPGIEADVRLVSSSLMMVLSVFMFGRVFESNKTRMGVELEAARAIAETARHDAQRVLDTVDQGLFTITSEGRVGPGISAAAVRWFGAPPIAVTAWEWLHDIDADAAAWLELGWDAHREGILPAELTLAQLPQRLQHKGRTYALRWLSTEREGELLAVATDITDVVEAERAERAQRELVAVLIRLIRDRQGIVEFLDEADAIVQALADAADPIVDGRRVHTLKGNAGLFGLTSFSAICHDVETRMAEREGVLEPADRRSLVGQWSELRARIDPFLGRDARGVVQVVRADIERLLDAVIEHQPYPAIEHELRRWTFEATRARLERIAEQARGLATRLDKGTIMVHVQDNGIALPPGEWTTFWSAFTHAIRNAVDHGLETPQQRSADGKPEQGQIWLSTAFEGGDLVITIRDDGRGIDWQTIAERASARDLPHATPGDLQRALLTDGVTTARTVTAVSGRGIGMAAVHEATTRLHGRIEIDSLPSQGTTFAFRFPSSAAGGRTDRLAHAA
jgi:signal transduction histidine kinase